MPLDVIIVIIITIGTFVLFITEKFRADVVAIFAMCALMLTGVVSPEEGISGFSNSAVVTVAAMLVLSTAIQRTGLIYLLGKKVFGFVGDSVTRQILAIALIVAPLSAFISNTATVAILIPMMFSLANHAKTSVHKTLIPLSYLAQLGGMFTIIGTTPNILANSLIAEHGLEPFSMFALSQIALVTIVFGILYLVLVGQFLLPDKKYRPPSESNIFLSQAKITNRSSFIGKTIPEIKKFPPSMEISEIIRGGKFFLRFKKVVLQEDDIIVFRAPATAIIQLLKLKGVQILGNFNPDHRRLNPQTQKTVRLAVSSSRFWVGKTLRDINFRDRYRGSIIGIDYQKAPESGNLYYQPLRNGDTILVAAHDRRWPAIMRSGDFVFLDDVEALYDQSKMFITLVILISVITTAALGILPIVTAAVAGVAALILTRCLRITQIYQGLNWQVILLIAGLIPLGIALKNTGITQMISDNIVGLTGNFHPLLLLGLFYLATTLITELISNAATVILLVPIAIISALELGFDPLPFVIAIMFGASTSFLTPIGYQTNAMVYTASSYRFVDFIRVGLPLNLALTAVIASGIYFLWGI